MPPPTRLLATLLLLVATGCTDLQLRRSTARQASTLTDLQYQQVLNNLAMLQADPSALPSLASLKTGTAQVSDTGSLGVGLDLGSRTHTTPNLMGTRSVVEQWGTSPVADDTTLRLLRLAYHRTMGDPRLLSVDEANDLAHTLSAQIGTNADISTDSDTLRALAAISRESNPAPSQGERTKDQAAAPSSLEQAGAAPPQGPGTSLPPLPRPGPRPTGPGGTGPPGGVSRDFRDPAPGQVTASGGITMTSGTIVDVETRREVDKVLVKLEYLDDSLTNTLDEDILMDDPANPPKFRKVRKVATGLAKETIRQVNDVQDTLSKLGPGWYSVGTKHDVPECARYVGHHGDVYTWVNPDGCPGLAEFTLAILNLSSLVKDTQVITTPTGIQFSPALAGTR